MKKVLIILLLLQGTLHAENQDHIPGFMDISLAAGRYYDVASDNVIGMSEINLAYGVEWEWLKPYAFFEWKSFYRPDGYNIKSNFPYRDLYGFGITIEFKRFFFVSYHHRCSHAVYTKENGGIDYHNDIRDKNFILFEGWPTATYDMFIIGIKTHID